MGDGSMPDARSCFERVFDEESISKLCFRLMRIMWRGRVTFRWGYADRRVAEFHQYGYCEDMIFSFGQLPFPRLASVRTLGVSNEIEGQGVERVYTFS